MAHGRTTAIGVMTAGAAVTIAGTLLPWVRTGGRARHSYDLFALVDRLGFSPDGSAALALRWWPLVPLLAVGAVVLAAWGHAIAGGVLAVLAAVYVGAVAITVGTRGAQAVDVLVGVPVTIAGTILLVGGAVAVVATSIDRARRGSRGARPGGPS